MAAVYARAAGSGAAVRRRRPAGLRQQQQRGYGSGVCREKEMEQG